MPSAMKQETKSEVTQSEQLFPLMVSTEQTSLNYMKRLTAVAISNILYLRNVFTEDCYGHRKLDHLKLRILTERCETMGAKQIIDWVKGCFDAMEKKYLKQLTLGIYTDPSDPDELIEAYTFRFSYHTKQLNITLNQNKANVMISEQSVTNELRNSTVQLLRSLVIMVQSLERLPNDCFLTMKLLYYEDITPKDYEPPGFMPSEKDCFTFKGRPISITAGEVTTEYHSLKLKIRTNQEQFQDLIPSQSSHIHEMEDECTPFQIDDDMDFDNFSQNKVSKNSDKILNFLSNNLNKQMIRPSVGSVKEKTRAESGSDSRKSAESNVVSRMKDMSFDDNNSESEEKRSTNVQKRKSHFEVTQDSVFNSLPNVDKRFKASSGINKKVIVSNKR